MPQEPEFAERYAAAKQEYERAAQAAPASAGQNADAGQLEAKERYREALAAYVLDLQVNGMTVPDELAAELSALD